MLFLYNNPKQKMFGKKLLHLHLEKRGIAQSG